MSQWDFIMGKRLRLCHFYAVTYWPDSVDGETSGFGTASNHE